MPNWIATDSKCARGESTRDRIHSSRSMHNSSSRRNVYDQNGTQMLETNQTNRCLSSFLRSSVYLLQLLWGAMKHHFLSSSGHRKMCSRRILCKCIVHCVPQHWSWSRNWRTKHIFFLLLVFFGQIFQCVKMKLLILETNDKRQVLCEKHNNKCLDVGAWTACCEIAWDIVVRQTHQYIWAFHTINMIRYKSQWKPLLFADHMQHWERERERNAIRNIEKCTHAPISV